MLAFLLTEENLLHLKCEEKALDYAKREKNEEIITMIENALGK